MHELSICQHIVDILEKQCAEHHLNKVTDVWLEIGALSCIEQSAVEFCFELCCKGTLAENCRLHFIPIPAQAYCWQCQRRVEIDVHQACCPHCHNPHLQRQQGDELRIKEIAVC